MHDSRSRWNRPLAGGLALWFGSHLAVAAIAVRTHILSPDRKLSFGTSDWFFSLFFEWDSKYFSTIATSGYFGPGSMQPQQAFFPGYPLAARLAAAAFGIAHPTVGQLTIFLWAVAGVASAVAAAALLVFGPYALFLEASYSESLFLALAITAWWVVSRGSWLLGGLLAGAASFTRINGVFLVLALVVLLVVHRRKLRRPYLGRAAGLAAIGLSGLSAYFAYLFVATGNIHAWSDAEAIGWHRSLNWPWATLANTVNESLHAQNPNLRVESALDLAFAVLHWSRLACSFEGRIGRRRCSSRRRSAP